MAISDAYATAAEYRAGIDKDSTGEDAEVLLDLTAVSRYIERRVGRFFNKDAAAVKRVYMPRFANPLDIDDLVSVTTIKIDTDNDLDFTDETALTVSTDYELLPRNAADGPEVKPYEQVLRVGGSWSTSLRVEIDGVWGWPAVPEAVKRACIHLTAILRLETPRAERQVSDIGVVIGMSREGAGIIDQLIADYPKVTL